MPLEGLQVMKQDLSQDFLRGYAMKVVKLKDA